MTLAKFKNRQRQTYPNRQIKYSRTLSILQYSDTWYCPSKHCSTGTIPAQYRGYCRNGTGPPLFYCHLRNSDLPFCTSAFYRSGTGKLLPYRYQPAQLHYFASIIYVVVRCWASTSPVKNLLSAWHWPRTINQCQGNEHTPLCEPANRTSTIRCFLTRRHLLCKGHTF